MIRLSRLKITGDINLKTPICVIQEIAECHGIKYDTSIDLSINLEYLLKIIKTINLSKVKTCNLKKQEDLKHVATFINPSIKQWESTKLIQSFNYMKSFIMLNKEDVLCRLKELRTIGNQTPDNIKSWNCCVLYKCCSLLDLDTTLVTTKESMFIKLKVLQNYDSLNSLIKDYKSEFNLYQLKNIEILLFNLIHYDGIVHFNKPFNILTNNDAINKGLENQRNYYISKNPLLSFLKNENIPLNTFFTPEIPFEFYDRDTLSALTRFELNRTSLSTRIDYDNLVEHRLLNNFYSGIEYNQCKYITNDKTPIELEDVQSILNTSPEKIILYGLYNSSMLAFTYNELTDLFNNQETFKNPCLNEHFEELSIHKLLGLSRFFNFNELTLSIDKVNKIIKSLDEDTLNFRNKYTIIIDKESVNKTLQSLLLLGMTMRGWDPETDKEFPIEKALVDDQTKVDINVSKYIVLYEEANKDSCINIDKLKLYRFRDGKYEHSVSDYEGRTIGERLNIVKVGESTNMQSSCIRMTSNWIVATACRYMSSINIDFKFDIHKLREIS
jgi:hypothetical protein